MPNYDYRCAKRGKRLSRIVSISAPGRRRPAGPKCKSTRVAQVFTAFYAKTVKKS